MEKEKRSWKKRVNSLKNNIVKDVRRLETDECRRVQGIDNSEFEKRWLPDASDSENKDFE